MAINPAELGRPIVYDFNEICDRVDSPAEGAWGVRKDIEQQLERIFDAESYHDETDAALAVGEIAKDVVVNGDGSRPRVVSLEPKIDGVVLSSRSAESAEKPLAQKDPDCRGFGECILKRMYGYDYASGWDGDVFERRLIIRGDVDLQLPRIRHNNR